MANELRAECEWMPRYFRSGECTVLNACEQMTEYNSTVAQNSRITALGDHPASAICSTATLGEVRMVYSEVRGRIRNSTGLIGNVLAVAIVDSGTACVHYDGQVARLAPGEGVVSLPGDDLIQDIDTASSFTIRAVMNSAALVRLKAAPFAVRRTLARKLEPEYAQQVLRLCKYVASELDSEAAQPKPRSPIFRNALADALRACIHGAAAHAMPDDRATDEIALAACLAADRAIQESVGTWLSAEQLADKAICSVRNLYRAFEQVGDVTPTVYQTRCRLYRVRNAVFSDAVPERSLDVLAERFGLGSGPRLASLYSAEFGEEPADSLRRIENLRQASG